MQPIINLTNESLIHSSVKELSILSSVKKTVQHIIKKGEEPNEMVTLLNTVATVMDTETLMTMGELSKHDNLVVIDEDNITNSSLNVLNYFFNTVSKQELKSGAKSIENLKLINAIKVEMDHPKYDFFAFLVHCMFTVGATITPLLISPAKCKGMTLREMTDIINEQFGFAYHKNGNTTFVQVKETIHSSGKLFIDIYFNNRVVSPFYKLELSSECFAALHQQLESFNTLVKDSLR